VLLPVAGQDPALRRATVVGGWRALPFDQRLLFNKLLTGALRVGVSQRLVQQALAEMSGIDIARLAQRMLGAWRPTPQFLAALLSAEDCRATASSRTRSSWPRRWKSRPSPSARSRTGCWSGNGTAYACS
jgi:hypothetical protein